MRYSWSRKSNGNLALYRNRIRRLHSPFFSDYLRALRTVVGLDYTAVLADRSLLSIYQWYLNHFFQHKEGDFREAQSAKTHIAQ